MLLNKKKMLRFCYYAQSSNTNDAHHRKAFCIRRGPLSKINYAQLSYNAG